MGKKVASLECENQPPFMLLGTGGGQDIGSRISSLASSIQILFLICNLESVYCPAIYVGESKKCEKRGIKGHLCTQD